LNGALRRTVKDERALEMIKSQDHSLTAMTNLLNSLLDISRHKQRYDFIKQIKEDQQDCYQHSHPTSGNGVVGKSVFDFSPTTQPVHRQFRASIGRSIWAFGR